MISTPRQPNTARPAGNSASVLAALLSALLLLSPGTARVVVHILAENGVALPAHVVRVLDTATLTSLRDVRRPEEEEGVEAVRRAASDTPAPNHEPAPVAVLPAPQVSAVAFVVDAAPRPVRMDAEQALPLSFVRSLGPPRAPPVV